MSTSPARRKTDSALHGRHAADVDRTSGLKRFQQLNAVRVQGAIPREFLDAPLRVLEDKGENSSSGIHHGLRR